MQKNVAGQIWVVFAFNRTTNAPLAGDSANITGNLRIDGGVANPIDDTNPTELEDGYYYFNITQAESNGNNIIISPVSTTADIQVIGVPASVYTTAPNFNSLGIESDGDLTKVNLLDGNTPQTGDNYARIGLNGAGLTNIDLPDQTMNITGNLSGSVGSVTGSVGAVTGAVTVGTNNDKTGYSISGTKQTLDVLNDFNPASDTVANVTTVATNTDMRGTDGANTIVPDPAGTAATPAQVNTEVLDVLTIDTHTEIGQVAPPSTVSFLDMLRYVYKSWRNKKTADGTTEKLYNDDGVTVGQQRTVSELAGTGTKEEMTIGS